ncbi:hypothetical protein OSTOST_01099 [Ostertagia ostertagi]
MSDYPPPAGAELINRIGVTTTLGSDFTQAFYYFGNSLFDEQMASQILPRSRIAVECMADHGDVALPRTTF